ncbi:MAG: hypothetical protein J0M08_12115 [Bacteroidetes bacterium]|nr:hypothetical protein [Bacteroidota bacterium]
MKNKLFLILFVLLFLFNPAWSQKQGVRMLSGTVVVDGKVWSQRAFVEMETNKLTIERKNSSNETVKQIVVLEGIKNSQIEIKKKEIAGENSYFLFLVNVKSEKVFGSQKFETDNILVPIPKEMSKENWKEEITNLLLTK